jgi:lipopolysaccharide export system permease protein
MIARLQLWRPPLHDRLVARAVLGSLAGVWIVLLGFDALLGFAGELDDLGKGGYSIGHVVLYIVCTIPRRVYELFPTSALIGSLLGLGGLAATSELTALRAAGISRWRICIGAVACLAVVTAVMMINAETLGPKGEQTAEAISVSAKSSAIVVSQGFGLWARDGELFVNARAGAQRLRAGAEEVELADVRLFQFGSDGNLQTVTRAKKAIFRDGHWTMRDVARTDFSALAVKESRFPAQEWKTGLGPETVLASVQHPRYQSTAELRANIDYMKRNAVDAGAYENAYWTRIFYPLNALAMCLAVLPFAFGQLRTGGFGKRLFAGIVCGLSFFVLQRFAQNLSTIYHWPLWIAHLAPPLLVLGVSRLYFRNRI